MSVPPEALSLAGFNLFARLLKSVGLQTGRVVQLTSNIPPHAVRPFGPMPLAHI